MLNNNKIYSHIALKIFVVILVFSALFYGCGSKKSILFWEEQYYYDMGSAKEAISHSADKKLDNVTELPSPLYNSSLLIIVPSQEMANWAKGEKHHSNEAIGWILETGLQMYASAIKKHNMFKTVVIISSKNRTTNRALFDYTLDVDGFEPRVDDPVWVIHKTGYDIKMPAQLAAEDFFTSESLNEAINNLKNSIVLIDEIISSMDEYKNIEKFLNESP